VSDAFQQALAALSGANSDVEKTYQQGKRRTLADIMMQSVNTGMANTLNMPAAGVAYDEANRPATNLAVANARAGILTGLGQTAAGMYGTNVQANTAEQQAKLGYAANVYGTQTQARTAASQTAANLSTNASSQALQKYIADLETKYRYGSSGASSGGSSGFDTLSW
jgi:hypothetical protein